MSQRIFSLFQKSIEAKMQVGEALIPHIEAASDLIVESLLNEGKVLICGNGVSAALAQIFCASLVDRFEHERPSLPAIWLGSNLPTYTAIAADSNFSEVFSKPINALGRPEDVLITISSSGNSSSLIQAVSAAHQRNLNVISISGRDGGNIASLLDESDVEICAAIDSRNRIHEIHHLVINCICDLVDNKLFGID